MFCVLTSYLSDKLEYVCCLHNTSYVSYIFHDVDADTFNTLLCNCVSFCYVILLFIVCVNIVLIYCL